jgi:Ribonuclease G/E
VWLKSGGYIVINQTEALVAIDINTGKYVGKSNRLEDTIVKTNTDAVKEIVRQIRLRDLGGIIVVDFIDMDERKNRQKVMQALEEAMRCRPRALQDSAVQRFRAGGHHPQAREAEPGADAVRALRLLRGRRVCQEPADPGGRDSAGSPQNLPRGGRQGRAAARESPEVAKVLKSNQNTYLQELEEILGRPVIVKSDPLLHQEKFDLA